MSSEFGNHCFTIRKSMPHLSGILLSTQKAMSSSLWPSPWPDLFWLTWLPCEAQKHNACTFSPPRMPHLLCNPFGHLGRAGKQRERGGKGLSCLWWLLLRPTAYPEQASAFPHSNSHTLSSPAPVNVCFPLFAK